VRHYRVSINGPEQVVAAVLTELGRTSGRKVAGASSYHVATSPEGIEPWKALSVRHPGVVLGVECFERFVDEYLSLVIEDGEVTTMGRHSVLPDDWGGFYDEDGERLDAELLRAAAETIMAQRLQHAAGTLSCGLDIALTMGKVLGRFCSRVDASPFDDPTREGLDVLIELAVIALRVSSCVTAAGRGERDFAHALRLTQSFVHGGRDELRDRPGEASWSEWLELLIGAASDVLEAACRCSFERETEHHALAAEHYGTPEEQLELAARSLLTTCLQALALFDSGPAGTAR
jgi:hypothetical protein